jgi:hypothetical protein
MDECKLSNIKVEVKTLILMSPVYLFIAHRNKCKAWLMGSLGADGNLMVLKL